jgi:poly(3-hydroxybutyrate) depolymerase
MTSDTRTHRLLILLVISFCAINAIASDKITKELLTSNKKTRAYYLFVPDVVKAPAPLLIVLHGSDRNGLSLVEKWKDIAAREGFIVAGPDSSDSKEWKTPVDGPDFLNDLVVELESKCPIDKRRVYLFGHSGGAVFTLAMSMFESKFFAAVALHAGAWRSPQEFQLLTVAKRKIPILIVVGDRDPFFPMSDVKSTIDKLKENGFDPELTIIKNHDHWYYDLAPKINEGAWTYLKKFALTEDPLFERYFFK